MFSFNANDHSTGFGMKTCIVQSGHFKSSFSHVLAELLITYLQHKNTKVAKLHFTHVALGLDGLTNLQCSTEFTQLHDCPVTI